MATEVPLTKPTLLRRPRPPKALTTTLKTTSDKTSLQKLPCSYTVPNSTQNTSTKSDFAIHSIYPRGPSFFPPGKKFVLHHGVGAIHLPPLYDSNGTEDTCTESALREDSDDQYTHCVTNEVEAEEDGDFTLSDFQVSVTATAQHRVLSKHEAKILSRQNYLKLTSWFAVNIPSQESINTMELEPDVVSPREHKPAHQLLLGMYVCMYVCESI